MVIRLLVGDDARIPPDAFIAPEHLDELTEVALHLAEQLGHVDVIEHGPVSWARLANWVGAELEVELRNATTDASGLDTDWDTWLAVGTDALRRRTAGDVAVWAWAAKRFAAAGHETSAAAARLADDSLRRADRPDSGRATGVRAVADRRRARASAASASRRHCSGATSLRSTRSGSTWVGG